MLIGWTPVACSTSEDEHSEDQTLHRRNIHIMNEELASKDIRMDLKMMESLPLT